MLLGYGLAPSPLLLTCNRYIPKYGIFCFSFEGSLGPTVERRNILKGQGVLTVLRQKGFKIFKGIITLRGSAPGSPIAGVKMSII